MLRLVERWSSAVAGGTMEDHHGGCSSVRGQVEGHRWMDGCVKERAREPRGSVGVRGVLKVLRGGNMKRKLTGSPRYYWVISRMCTR